MGEWTLLQSSVYHWTACFNTGSYLQWRMNMPLMTGYGWRWEGVWACFMRITASSDCRNRSGYKGPSMYLSESSVGMAWWPTSLNPIPRPVIRGQFTQICQIRPPVGEATGRVPVTVRSPNYAYNVRTVGWSWWTGPWWPIADDRI